MQRVTGPRDRGLQPGHDQEQHRGLGRIPGVVTESDPTCLVTDGCDITWIRDIMCDAVRYCLQTTSGPRAESDIVTQTAETL